MDKRKLITTALVLFFTLGLFAQEVRSVSYTKDSLGYKLLITYKGGRVHPFPEDSVGTDGIEYPKRVDSLTLVKYLAEENLQKAEETYRTTALNIIALNENQKIEREFNKVLRQLTGFNYQQYVMNTRIDSSTIVANTFTGFYAVNVQDTVRILEFRLNGNVRQVTTRGQVVTGGFTGEWRADSRNGFTLTVLRVGQVFLDKVKFVSVNDANLDWVSLNYRPIRFIAKTEDQLKSLR